MRPFAAIQRSDLNDDEARWRTSWVLHRASCGLCLVLSYSSAWLFAMVARTDGVFAILPPTGNNHRKEEGNGMAESFETMVRVYKTTDAYQSDLAKLTKKGWITQTVTERKPRAGCARIILLWWFTLIFPPKPELVVTYMRTRTAERGLDTAQGVSVYQSGSCPNCGAPVGDKAFFCPNCNHGLRR
jgi:hypothetical protein